MKKWIFVLLIATTFYMSGCGKLEKSTVDNESQNDSEVAVQPKEEGDELPVQEPNEISEFSILVGDNKVSLMDWDYEVDLEEIFGKPIQEEIQKLGFGSDTYEGSYIKEIKFPGIEFKLFSPKDNGETFYILSMESRDSKFQIGRGIKVGDGLDKLNKIYPEIKPVLDGRKDINNRGYKIEGGAYNHMIFEVKQGLIDSIKIYHEFP